ncbi:hypothetical protein ACJJTC_018447 [Scirpophaga incertulas]
MLTRSKLVRGDVLATSAADSGVPRADVLDRASGPVLAETLAAPNPVTVLSAQNLQNDVIQSTKSINSQRSSQSKSSATVRALRATAEAKLARQQLERQVQLENERRRIEELELAAELASIDAGHSSKSSSHLSSRTAAWVADQASQSVNQIDRNILSSHNRQRVPTFHNNENPSDIEKLATAIASAVLSTGTYPFVGRCVLVRNLKW